LIYYVEDDPNIRELVIYTLRQTGFEARGFSDAPSFFAACQAELPELLLLDIMLPNESGLTILRNLRSDAATTALPIILVTARATEYDKVVGLDSGADDYIAKPFGMMELISRVRALLRRSKPMLASEELVAENLVLNTQKHTVTVNGQLVVLTYKEFALLRFLMENRGIAFHREQLLSTVWGYDYEGGSRTVDVHIQTLRQKLGECGPLIETVRGVGYRFGDA
jgi:two-component system alkaline phosphatase synthesis response regulator PhoP